MLMIAPASSDITSRVNRSRLASPRISGQPGTKSPELNQDVPSIETSTSSWMARLQSSFQNAWQLLKTALTPTGFQFIKQWVHTKIRQALTWLDTQQRRWLPHSRPIFSLSPLEGDVKLREPETDPLVSEHSDESSELGGASLKRKSKPDGMTLPASVSNTKAHKDERRKGKFLRAPDGDEQALSHSPRERVALHERTAPDETRKKHRPVTAFAQEERAEKIPAHARQMDRGDRSVSESMSSSRQAGCEVTKAVADLFAKHPHWQADLKMVNWEGIGDNLHWLLRDIKANTQRAASFVGFPDISSHMAHPHLRYLASRFHRAVTEESQSVTPRHLKSRVSFTMPSDFDESPEQTAQRIGNALTRYFENNPESQKAHARRPWGDMVRAIPPSLQNLREAKVFNPMLAIATPFFSQFIPDPILLRLATQFSEYLRGF